MAAAQGEAGNLSYDGVLFRWIPSGRLLMIIIHPIPDQRCLFEGKAIPMPYM